MNPFCLEPSTEHPIQILIFLSLTDIVASIDPSFDTGITNIITVRDLNLDFLKDTALAKIYAFSRPYGVSQIISDPLILLIIRPSYKYI